MLIVLKSLLWAKQSLTVLKNGHFSYSLLPKIFKSRRSRLRLVFLLKIVYNIVWTSPPCFKAGGSKFWLLPPEGGIWKIRKRGWRYSAGAGSLKVCVYVCVCERGERSGTDTFRIYFFQGLSFLHIEIGLPFPKLCYAFEEKLFFSVTIILWKKVILSRLKMNLKLFHKLR